MKTLLICGVGGGLDIVSAYLFACAARADGHKVLLGAVHPLLMTDLDNHQQFCEAGTVVNSETRILKRGRYAEPLVAQILEEPILLFSRGKSREPKVSALRDAIQTAREQHHIDDCIFIDGGGDSLILRKEDAMDEYHHDVFSDGDAVTLAALVGMEHTYLGIVSIGLDIKPDAFFLNLQLLRCNGHYHGRVNMATGKQEEYDLSNVATFQNYNVEKFIAFAQRILVLDEADQINPMKERSHTATVTYHAVKGNYGLQQTFVPWEPNSAEGKGVVITPEHRWMYFLDAGTIHKLKCELNGAEKQM